MLKVLTNNGKALVSNDGKLYQSKGIIPSGTLAIDSNGTHQVREYESVEVKIDGVVAVFEPKTNNEIEVVIAAIPITTKRYINSFVGNAEIIIE